MEMWEGQSVKRPLKWKLKKLLSAVCYMLMSLVLIACLYVIYLLEIAKYL